MAGALRGRTVVVTRPAAQAAPLLAAIAAEGGTALGFPLLEIEPLPSGRVHAAAAPWLDGAALAIFVSPNAVRHGIAPLLARSPAARRLAVAAVGEGTAKALADLGYAGVVVPAAGFDSEALLAHPALAADAVGDRDVLLFKGEGGRETLAATLAGRGARVRPVVCYRRRPPAQSPDALCRLAEQGRLDAIVVTSSEALRHFDALLGEARPALRRAPLLVATHPRIADAATRLGFARVLATPPGDAAVIAALTTYNWPPPSA